MNKRTILFLGDPNVGKTSLITRYIKDIFTIHSTTTLQVETVSTVETVDHTDFHMYLIDTPGTIDLSFRRNDIDAYCIVYDASRPDLESVKKWMEYVPDDMPLLIVGTKRDILGKVKSDSLERSIEEFCEGGVDHLYVSAKSSILSLRRWFLKVIRMNLRERRKRA